MPHQPRILSRHYQEGNVLLVCLALMMIMTIWGVTSTRNTSFNLQTNQNARFKQVSFEAAEFTLRQMESLIRNEVTTVDRIPDLYDGTSGRFSMVIGSMPIFVDIEMPPRTFDYRNSQDWLKGDWSGAIGGNFNDFSFIEVEYDNNPDSSTYLTRQPRAIIEYMGRDMYDDQNRNQPQGRHIFRISAIGWGPQGISSTVLRSHIALAI